MPTAREALLDAALAALARRPWPAVRMVDVAGGRRGLPADPLQRVRQQGGARPRPGPAGGRRAISTGVERAAGRRRAPAGAASPRVAEWTVSGPPAATRCVRALLTGAGTSGCPRPAPAGRPARARARRRPGRSAVRRPRRRAPRRGEPAWAASASACAGRDASWACRLRAASPRLAARVTVVARPGRAPATDGVGGARAVSARSRTAGAR